MCVCGGGGFKMIFKLDTTQTFFGMMLKSEVEIAYVSVRLAQQVP